MTPGTKVRTKVALVFPTLPNIPAGSEGVVEANNINDTYPVEVAIVGRSSTFNYRSDELEVIE